MNHRQDLNQRHLEGGRGSWSPSLTTTGYCAILLLCNTVQKDTAETIGHSIGSSELVRHVLHRFSHRETMTLPRIELSRNG